MDAKTISRILEACKAIAYAHEEAASAYADRFAVAHSYLSTARISAREIEVK